MFVEVTVIPYGSAQFATVTVLGEGDIRQDVLSMLEDTDYLLTQRLDQLTIYRKVAP